MLLTFYSTQDSPSVSGTTTEKPQSKLETPRTPLYPQDKVLMLHAPTASWSSFENLTAPPDYELHKGGGQCPPYHRGTVTGHFKAEPGPEDPPKHIEKSNT